MFNNRNKKPDDTRLKSSAVASKKRKVLEARDLWIDYFSDILNCLSI